MAEAAEAALQLGFGALGLDEEQAYFHVHWVDCTQLTRPIAFSVVNTIQAEYEGVLGDERETELTLKYGGVKWLSDLATCAFLNKYFNAADDDEARADLDTTYELVNIAREKGLIECTYLNGIVFVLDRLYEFVNGFPVENGISSDYEALASKSKALILGMKDYFIDRMPGKFWHHLGEAPEEMISLDPSNALWHTRLYKKIWHHYREPGSISEKKERLARLKAAIEQAFALDPEDPTVLLYLTEYAMELRRRLTTGVNPRSPVQFAGNEFQNAGELDEFVMNKIGKVLEVCPTIRSRVSIAMSLAIWSNSGRNMANLRSPAQIQMAKQCLDEAYEKCPRSGIVSHKLALYALIIDRNVDGAIVHLRRAVELDPNHFSSLVDLIICLMANPTGNEAAVQELIEANVVETAPWSVENKAELVQLKGSLLFMLGRHAEGIQFWKEAWTPEIAKHLRFKHDRYQWPKSLINLELMTTSMITAFQQERSETLRAMIQCVLETARPAIGRELGYALLGAAAGAEDGRDGRGHERWGWRGREHGVGRVPVNHVVGSPEGQRQVGAGGPGVVRIVRASPADLDNNWRNH